jgi:bifunctional DNA-binding transcriptional regulator/antitoxin component of YhaV-PrlF toxin-antitoxin module
MSTYEDDLGIVAISRVFQKGKTVIPSEVRRLLGVSDGDKILWRYDKVRGIVYIQITGGKQVRYTLSREKSSI